MVAAEHREIAGAGHTTTMERKGMIGVTLLDRPTAPREAAPAVSVFDQLANHRCRPICGPTLPGTVATDTAGSVANSNPSTGFIAGSIGPVESAVSGSIVARAVLAGVVLAGRAPAGAQDGQ
jgi:hypothetical protein